MVAGCHLGDLRGVQQDFNSRSSNMVAGCLWEDSAHVVRSGPFHRIRRPALRNLSTADPSPCPSPRVDTPPRGNR